MAENHIQPDKMAVNSVDEQSTKSSHKENNVEENDIGMKDNVNFQNAQDSLYNTRKKSSFQITRVITKSGGSDHADGEVDDDLDETNTEEVSSELLDISKTTDTDHDPPSEDTISAHSIPASSEDFQKDINSSHIPSSSTPQVSYQQNHVGDQAIVTQSKASAQSIQQVLQLDKFVSDIQQIDPNTLEPLQAIILPEQGKEKSTESRFKVVKIQSEQPFRRGRWQCVDCLTPPSNERSEKAEDVGSHGSGSSSAASSVHYIPGVDDPSRNPLLEGQIINVIPQNGEFSTSQSQTFNGNQSSYSNGTHNVSHASMPAQLIPTKVPTTLTQTHMQNVLPQASMPESVSQQFTANPPSSSAAGNGQVSHGQGAQSQSSFSQANVPPKSANQSVTQQSQNVNSDNEFIPPPSTDYIPNSTNTQNNAQKPQETSSQSQPSTNSTEYNASNGGTLSNNVPLTQSSTQSSDYVPETAPVIGQSKSTSPGNENVHYSSSSSNNNDNNKKFTKNPDASYSSSTEIEQTVQPENERSDQRPEDISTKFSTELSTAQLIELTFDMSNKSDDEGGASTVAIDNKIEQAMDLVKSHLMYAVREEVEVLREQIKELLEKNSQLEYENQILKKAATKETMAKLQQPRPSHSLTQGPPSTTSS